MYWTSTEDGVRLHIRVTTRASQSKIGPVENDRLKIYVVAIPEDGRANKAIIALLAKHFRLAKSNIELISGHQSRDKTFLLKGLATIEEASS